MSIEILSIRSLGEIRWGTRVPQPANRRIELQLRCAPTPSLAETLGLPESFRSRYDIERVIQRGAACTVVRAISHRSGRIVAVKLLTDRRNRDAVERFAREASFLRTLRHPRVVRLLEADTDAAVPCFVMEWLEGGSLRDLLADGRALEPARVVELLADALAGAAACHRAGIVHRDLKPDNILITGRGGAKIADLGVATHVTPDRAGDEDVLVGTPVYMSPEQLLGAPAGPESDIYSLGVVAFELLTGRHPFGGTTVDELYRWHHAPTPRVDAVAPHVPAALADVVHAAMSRDPAARPRSAGEMAERLRRSLPARRVRGGDARPLSWIVTLAKRLQAAVARRFAAV